MHRLFVPVGILMAFFGSASADAPRPNVLILLADDLGYSDLGCYGGEIQTPHLDRMASEGLQFTHFRATPMCVTSRIAMLAGMPMELCGGHSYSHSMPLPMAMKSAGYRTLMTGKWHAGSPDPRSRDLFDRSFGFLSGMTDSFVGADDWFLDDKNFDGFDQGFYSTDAFADRSIEFMKESVSKGKPFLMYVAFNAPHHPCQAPKATVEKYATTYSAGYSTIRDDRLRRQREMGLIDSQMPVTELSSEVRRWDELTAHRKRVESDRMAAYAAAVDHVDQSVGRMLRYLDSAGIADQTLVIFMSDNGGDYSNGSLRGDEGQIPWAPGGNPSSSNGWAAVKATPMRLYKHSCHEGGIAVPMIVRWPEGFKGGRRVNDSSSIMDLYPTLLEIAGADRPTHYRDQPTRPLAGSSLMPLLTGDGDRDPRPIFVSYDHSKGWIDGQWKAVQLYGGPWQLFDLVNDRGETNDLSASQPQRLRSLVNRCRHYAGKTLVSGFDEASRRPQKSWGWHRMRMVLPYLKSISPWGDSVVDGAQVDLKIEFDQEVSFRDTAGKRLSLYSYANESEPLWQSDPQPDHAYEGMMTLTLGDLPKLKPNTQYFLLADPGWIRVGDRPAGPINDGAFWWRFSTAP